MWCEHFPDTPSFDNYQFSRSTYVIDLELVLLYESLTLNHRKMVGHVWRDLFKNKFDCFFLFTYLSFFKRTLLTTPNFTKKKICDILTVALFSNVLVNLLFILFCLDIMLVCQTWYWNVKSGWKMIWNFEIPMLKTLSICWRAALPLKRNLAVCWRW